MSNLPGTSADRHAEVLVRPARSEDAPEVARLLGHLGYPAETGSVRRRLEAFSDSPRDVLLVAERQPRLVGMVAVSTTPRVGADEPFARITALVVDPSERRTGIGRRLLHEAEAWAAGASSALVQVTSGRRPERSAAHHFYRRFGYEDRSADEVLYEKAVDRRRAT